MKLLGACAAAAVFAYLMWFAWPGLLAPFTSDDLMNLHSHLQAGAPGLLKGLAMYWSGEYRPLGGLFYVAIYRAFGFDPLPFRVACFLLIALNLFLLYRFSLLLSGSREVAALAALIASYHAWFVDIYYTTGTVYELLCFAFYFGALTFYIRIRRSGRTLRPREWAVFLVLYIFALDSKEMAATLPIAIGVFELVSLRAARNLLATLVTAAMAIPYAIGKTTGAGVITANPQYQPEITWHHFLHAFRLYTNVLFYRESTIRGATVMLLLVVMLELALLARSQTMGYAWCFLIFSTLPFIFLPRYAGFFLYIPMAGWALYASQALVLARDALLRTPRRRSLVQALTFAAVALVLAPLHARQTPKTLRVFSSIALPSREVSAELTRRVPALPPSARIAFLNDRQPGGYWLLFLVRLQYDDLGIEVARTSAPVAPAGKWDVILAWEGAKLRLVPRG
ncbi:MAG TPA: hypothetical protein VHA11_03430 [Bryobacteraceae bacterium]|nr:hypothetical protein [Bryobacteraceae bacterium]